jgi:hypothetical protein
MTVLQKNGQKVILIDREAHIASAQDLLDLFATAHFTHDSGSLMVYKESLGEDFFDLKTGVAGELLQKCSNYRMKLAIIGDFSVYQSKSLKDFIYECNKGKLVYFKSDIDSALDALTAL